MGWGAGGWCAGWVKGGREGAHGAVQRESVLAGGEGLKRPVFVGLHLWGGGASAEGGARRGGGGGAVRGARQRALYEVEGFPPVRALLSDEASARGCELPSCRRAAQPAEWAESSRKTHYFTATIQQYMQKQIKLLNY